MGNIETTRTRLVLARQNAFAYDLNITNEATGNRRYDFTLVTKSNRIRLVVDPPDLGDAFNAVPLKRVKRRKCVQRVRNGSIWRGVALIFARKLALWVVARRKEEPPRRSYQYLHGGQQGKRFRGTMVVLRYRKLDSERNHSYFTILTRRGTSHSKI